MTAPDRDTQLARRIYRLPIAYKTVILQLINKCEDLRTKDCIERHLHNANSIVTSCSAHSGYQRLPKVKTKYYFIEKQSRSKLTIEQMARKFQKSTKTIYYWIYTKYQFLFNNYEVIRE
ncbi:MAG: hypothetical protein K0R49_82 [Burkholderiales bacterium]|jgi:hypothetical protein|nr:hypothetical protein [Burkholderiales bacterium]